MPDIPAYKPDKAPAGKTAGAKSPPRIRFDSGSSGRKGNARLSSDRPFKASITELREALEAAAGYAVLGFSAAGDMHCAEIVMDGAPELIDSWIWLAEKHKEVRRALEILCGSGGYLALITSTLGIALPIMQHHGMYPANAPTPRSLKSVMANMFTQDADTDDQQTQETAD